MKEPLPPIRREVVVSWDPASAFRRFAVDFASWWPVRTHSIGGPRVRRVVLEPRVGGLIFEEHEDGRRFRWGEVLAWDPPHALRFTWHPSREPETAQDVVVRFDAAEGGSTRVTLVADGWERWGKGASRARRGYDLGWGQVLALWSGRRTLGSRAVDLLVAGARLVERMRPRRERPIRAGGEMPPASR